MTIKFPPRLSLAQIPTPLQLLSRVSDSLDGPRIWIKRDDLTGSVLSGNKIRKLEFTLAQAKAEGCDSLVTCGGLQSNHCRATALVGAQLGMKVKLVLRGAGSGADTDEPDGNLLLDYLAGADITTFPAGEYTRRLPELLQLAAQELQQEGMSPFIIPTGASDDIGVWGYVRACQELREDFVTHAIKPSHIVCATGSGGTQAGLTVGAQLFKLGAQVMGMAVCDDEAYFHAKVREDLQAWQRRYAVPVNLQGLDIQVNANYIGPGYAKADQAVFDCIQWLAMTEGVVLDPVYTGKAFYGLVEEIKAGRYAGVDDVVFIHTGGIFGLYPQKSGFSF